MPRVIFSPLNSISFVPTSNEDAFINGDWLKNRLPYHTYNRQVNKYQLVQFGDIITVEVHLSFDLTAFPPLLSIFSCESSTTPIATVSVAAPYQSIYNTRDINGNIEYFSTFLYIFRIGDYTTTEGLYYIRGRFTFGDIQTTYISEPLHCKAIHNNTQFLRYAISENRLETIVEGFNVDFGRRFKLKVDDMTPERSESDFILDNQQLIKVSSYPYNTTKLLFDEVADYELDALNRIFACDRFKIGNKVFVTNEQIEKSRSGNDPLYRATIEVRDADLLQPFSFVGTQTVVFFQFTSYPFMLYYAFMQDGYNSFSSPNNIEIANLAALTALVADMNVTASNIGMAGEFVINGNGVDYQNAIGEQFGTAEYQVAQKRWEIDVTIGGLDLGFIIELQNFYSVVDWGDGTTQRLDPPSFNYARLSHTYEDAGAYMVKIWHKTNPFIGNPEGTGLRINVGNTSAKVNSLVNVNGSSPNLQEFVLDYPDIEGGTLDLTWLQQSKANLQSVVVIRGGVSVITATAFDLPGTQVWDKLKTVYFNNNELSTGNANDLMVTLRNNLFIPLRGIVNLKNQTPAAPMVAGSTAKNTLINAGWSVQTD